jgi:hypothetical protein
MSQGSVFAGHEAEMHAFEGGAPGRSRLTGNAVRPGARE